MKIKNKIIAYQTKGEFDFQDITDGVEKFIKESQIKNGLVNIQTLHTTAALILQEQEPLLIEDIKKNLENTAPKNLSYKHDDFSQRTVNMCGDECANGHSHCKAMHLQPNITLNLIDGKLQLGRWQRVLFIELDRSRDRKIQIQIIGE